MGLGRARAAAAAQERRVVKDALRAASLSVRVEGRWWWWWRRGRAEAEEAAERRTGRGDDCCGAGTEELAETRREEEDEEAAAVVEDIWAGGWEKALGRGRKAGKASGAWVQIPTAVAVASASSSSSESGIGSRADGGALGWKTGSGSSAEAAAGETRFSVELVRTGSSSLSVSSYSSWLLVPVAGETKVLVRLSGADTATRDTAWCSILLRRAGAEAGSWRLVMAESSAMEDRDEDDGCDEMSTHDSIPPKKKKKELKRGYQH